MSVTDGDDDVMKGCASAPPVSVTLLSPHAASGAVLQNKIVSQSHTMCVELRAISDICCIRMGNSGAMHIHACMLGAWSAICI